MSDTLNVEQDDVSDIAIETIDHNQQTKLLNIIKMSSRAELNDIIIALGKKHAINPNGNNFND